MIMCFFRVLPSSGIRRPIYSKQFHSQSISSKCWRSSLGQNCFTTSNLHMYLFLQVDFLQNSTKSNLILISRNDELLPGSSYQRIIIICQGIIYQFIPKFINLDKKQTIFCTSLIPIIHFQQYFSIPIPSYFVQIIIKSFKSESTKFNCFPKIL